MKTHAHRPVRFCFSAKMPGRIFMTGLVALSAFCNPAWAQNIATMAGDGRSHADDIPARQARIILTGKIAFDAAGLVCFADSGSHKIRKIDAHGRAQTVVNQSVTAGVPVSGHLALSEKSPARKAWHSTRQAICISPRHPAAIATFIRSMPPASFAHSSRCRLPWGY